MSTDRDPPLLPHEEGAPSDTQESDNVYDDGTFLNFESESDANGPVIKSDKVINMEIEPVPGCAGALKISVPELTDAEFNVENEDVRSSSRRVSRSSFRSNIGSDIVDLDTYVFTNSALNPRHKKKSERNAGLLDRRAILSTLN